MPRIKQFDEQQVLEKAMDLFWKLGYNGTSIQDLVEHLGINRASLYDTYGGKDALFEKSFEHYLQKNTQMARSILAAEPSVKEGFRHLFEIIIAQIVNDPERKGCFAVNTTTELIPNDEKWLPILNRNRQNFESIFLENLQRGVVQGEISAQKDLKSIAALLFTLNNGLNVVAKINPSRAELLNIAKAGISALD